MSTFKLREKVQASPDIVDAALGVNVAGALAAADIGKPVKLGASDNYLVCSTGDEIEGIVYAIDSATVNSGWAFGSVRKSGRIEATVDAAQVGTLVPGELVVAGVQVAVGTAGKITVLQGTPADHKWRCISIVSGTGVAGDTVVVEKI